MWQSSRDSARLFIRMVACVSILAGGLPMQASAQSGSGGPSVDALVARLAELEARLAMLEKEGSTVEAPFQIVDRSGQTILAVETSRGYPSLVLRGADGSRVTLEARPGLALVEATQGVRGFRSLMQAEAKGGTAFQADTPDYLVSIGSIPDGSQGFFMRKGRGSGEQAAGSLGHPVAEIGTRPGKGPALRLYNDAGNVVVSAGANPAASASGSVRIADPQGGVAAFMGTTPDGRSGAVAVTKGNQVVASMQADPAMIAIFGESGAAIAAFRRSQNGSGPGGNVALCNPQGEPMFSAGFASDGAGEACVLRKVGGTPTCLGVGLPGFGGGQ